MVRSSSRGRGWLGNALWDLRDKVHDVDLREKRRDLADILAHPVVVILTFVVGMFIFLWGVWAAASYIAGRDNNLVLVWWQMSIAFFTLTVLSFALPYRIRFGFNLFGILSVTLMMQYGLFMVCFPISWLTHEQVEAIRVYNLAVPKDILPQTKGV